MQFCLLHQLRTANEIVTSRLNNSYSFALANDSVVISIAVFSLLYIARLCGWRETAWEQGY